MFTMRESNPGMNSGNRGTDVFLARDSGMVERHLLAISVLLKTDRPHACRLASISTDTHHG